MNFLKKLILCVKSNFVSIIVLLTFLRLITLEENNLALIAEIIAGIVYILTNVIHYTELENLED